ncbi:MAG: redoxin domain-containing protein [Anaerolineales bacterium]|nr:redoxin domain-containing protein [Anaerolineales bacterium]
MDSLVHIGQPAPDFSLADLDGNSHTLLQQQGKIVVINFWSAECPWSLRADEALAEWIPDLGDDVIIWPIASNKNETMDQIRATANERGLSIVLRDEDLVVADLYGAVTTPHFFVVDREGILQYMGALDDVVFRQPVPTKYYLKDAVESLLESSTPDPAETPGYGCTIIRYRDG